MEVDYEGRLPITHSLFERLWAPIKSPGFTLRHVREVGNTRGLGCPSIFTSNVVSTIILGDSSSSEDDNNEGSDEDLIVLSTDNYGYPSQNEVLATLVQSLEVEIGEITDTTSAPK